MKFTILVIIVFVSFNSLFSDSLYLANNNVVKGKIVSMDDKIVRIETANGILEVEKTKIVRGEFFGEGNELSGDLILEFLLNGKIKDSSGNGYPVKTKSIPYTKGVFNDDKGALKSEGEGQYFYVENSKMLNEIDSFTVAMNFYPQDTSENRFLVSNWNNTYGNGKAEGRFSLSVLGDSLMFFVVDSKGYYQSVGAKNVINLKKWNSIAVRFNKGELSLFVNGKTVAKNSISETELLKGEWPLYFLTAKYGENFKKYNIIGYIDNIKVFNTSLSDSELNLLYKSQKS